MALIKDWGKNSNAGCEIELTEGRHEVSSMTLFTRHSTPHPEVIHHIDDGIIHCYYWYTQIVESDACM